MTKFVVACTWEDAPHLSKDDKELLWAGISPHEREARSKGIPALGSGAIYPIAESDIIVPGFAIPPEWPRVAGFDPGFGRAACVWAAIDPNTDIVYVYSEYYRAKSERPIHAEAIKARGQWIPCATDYAGSRDDGVSTIQAYQELGVSAFQANKAVDAGIDKVWQMLSSGQLKVFDTLPNWLSEFRIYRRDDKGRIVKKHDHLMDATRYCIMAIEWADCLYEDDDDFYQESGTGITGY